VKERLAQKEIKLNLSESVVSHLAKEGYSPQYGARPLKRLIQTKILTPIASLMVSKGLSKGGSVSVDMKAGEFSFSVKKGKNGSFVTESFVSDNVLA
jgi:ATP-dependent Clp protease ATP-binding subunit ClpA